MSLGSASYLGKRGGGRERNRERGKERGKRERERERERGGERDREIVFAFSRPWKKQIRPHGDLLFRAAKKVCVCKYTFT